MADTNTIGTQQNTGPQQSSPSRDRLLARIKRDFAYHQMNADQQGRAQGVRDRARQLAEYIAEMVPEGREQSRALTALEDVMFNANAGIARNPLEGRPADG